MENKTKDESMDLSLLRQKVDGIFAGHPVFEYALIPVAELTFSDKVRHICRHECDQYGKSWVCSEHMPPLDACVARCHEFEYAALFSTVSEVAGTTVFAGHLAARREHEDITSDIEAKFKEAFGEVLTLSTGCMLCEECAYPEPCRHPADRRCTAESHGLLVLSVAAEHGLNFDCGENIVTYFSIILFNK